MDVSNFQQASKMDERSYFSREINLLHWSKLKVADIMSHEPVTVAPQETMQQAALIMTEKRVSCVLIITDNQVKGILSQKDIVAGAHSHGPSANIRVGDIMSQPVKTVEPLTPVLWASMVMTKMRFKRLPVVLNQEVLGIITQTDLVRAYESMSALRSVAEIMTTELVTMKPEDSVAQALDVMVQRRISSVLIIHKGEARGIFTEKDVLRMVVAQGEDPQNIQLVDVMSFPLITVTTSYSVLSASRLMYDRHLHRLVVTDAKGACGIVTRTDILKSYQTSAQSEIEQELHLLWQTEDAVFLLDAEGNTTFVNPAFLKLFKADRPEIFMGRPFPPEELWGNPTDKWTIGAKQRLETGDSECISLRTLAGECLSLRLCLCPIRDSCGNLIGKRGSIWN